MEASALQAPAGLTRSRISIGASLLRLRSDEQLVALFRAGHDEAFCAIHDRYRQRLLAYTRQMLSRQDAEDALQEVFVRAYAGLRANRRELALRAWLYRVAHNRCIDELRRPLAPAPEVLDLVRPPIQDPVAQAEQREVLRRLIADVQRLPEQQRSALLMRELGGMSYHELADALGVSVPAVKSLLVRARGGIVQSLYARETACSAIRDELTLAHDRGVRPNATAKRHLRDCAGCRQFRHEIRGASRQLAAFAPAVGPLGLVAKLLGLGGGSGGSVAAGGGAAATGAVAGTGGALATGGLLGAATGTHIAALLAAAVLTAGGAVEIQHSISAPVRHPAGHRADAAAGASEPGRSIGKPGLDSGRVSAASTPSARGRLAATAPRSVRGAARGGPGSPPAAKSSSRTSGAPADFIGAAGQLVGPGGVGSTTATPLGDGPATPGPGSSTSGDAGARPSTSGSQQSGTQSNNQSSSGLLQNPLPGLSGGGPQSSAPGSGSPTVS